MTRPSLDWALIAKLAARHEIRYPTNARMENFIVDAISAYLSSIGGVVCALEPIGYGVWINGKLSGCAKSHRDSFPLHAPLSIAGKGDGWMPIAEADSDIAYVHDFGETLRIGNSYPIWARDADGRVFECLWADDGKKSYWWDIEGESPVDPVEFMPHPLDPRFHAPPSRSEEGSDKL